jgi:hypothetical protein
MRPCASCLWGKDWCSRRGSATGVSTSTGSCPYPGDAEYEIANRYTATHPANAFANNLIAARPGLDGTRLTLFHGRLTNRRPTGAADRRCLQNTGDYR